MKRWSLSLLFVLSLLGAVMPASAVELRCVAGWALVDNSSEDQTIDVAVGIIYQIGGNINFGPLGAAVEVLPGNMEMAFTPNTYIPVTATDIEVYPNNTQYSGIYDQGVSSCDAAAPTASGFGDGRLNANGADTAVVFGSGGSYTVWGVDPNGEGFEAFSFTCAALQTALSGAQAEANGNYLLESAAAPGRSGDIQLWAVPGSGRVLGLVLVSPGQGGDSGKQTIVPLGGLCPNLTAA